MSFPGATELRAYILNTPNPSFNSFVAQHLLDGIPRWSIDSSNLEAGALYGLWKKRFVLELKNCNRRGSLVTSHLKFNSTKWNLIKETVDELVCATLSVRKDTVKAIGEASFLASVQITKVLQQRSQESQQEVDVSQNASQSSTANHPRQEQHRHSHQALPVQASMSENCSLDLGTVEQFLHTVAYKKLSGSSLNGKEKRILGRINNNNATTLFKNILMIIAAKTLQKETLLTVDESIIKSSLSSIMNFINPTIKAIIMDQMDPSMRLQVKNVNFGLTTESGLGVESSDVFDQVMAFNDGTDNTDAMLAFILTTKADLIHRSQRRSQVFQMLSLLEQLIDNIGLWHKNDHESEITFYRRFASLLDILFKDTEIELADGETGCISTKPAIELNKALFQTTESSATYGRKIDLLMKYDGANRVELCSNEWKKSNVSPNLMIKQQCKNLRINTAILSSLNEQYGGGFKNLMAMDWTGHIGYLYMLEKHDDVFFSSFIHTLMIPKEAANLPQVKATLDHLFLLKNFMVTMCKELKTKMLDHEMNKRLLGVTHSQPLNNVAPPPFVFFTPSTSRVKKRKLQSLEDDDDDDDDEE